MLKKLRETFGKLRDIHWAQRQEALLKSGEFEIRDAFMLKQSDTHLSNLVLCEDLGIENVVAAFPMPMGLAEHFKVNGREIPAVPMVTEEKTIIAAASKAAKLVSHDGFLVVPGSPVSCAQVLLEIPDAGAYVDALPSVTAEDTMEAIRADIVREDLPFRKYGGGELLHLKRHFLRWDNRSFAELTLYVTTGEAMGARGVTAYAKAVGDFFARTRDWKPVSWICLNDNPLRTVLATAEWPVSTIGRETMKRVQDNQAWAEKSEQRSITHNKGVMNGIDAVAIATGQDVRAIEAGAWSSAADDGPTRRRFRPLTSYRATETGLRGSLEMQLTVGTVGGATGHPFAQFSRRLMGAETSAELMAVMGAVGLAQNFAALAWALDT